MALGSLQKALVNAGLAEAPQERKFKAGKPVKCRKCGKAMYKIPDSNMAVCQNDDCKGISYIVFDR